MTSDELLASFSQIVAGGSTSCMIHIPASEPKRFGGRSLLDVGIGISMHGPYGTKFTRHQSLETANIKKHAHVPRHNACNEYRQFSKRQVLRVSQHHGLLNPISTCQTSAASSMI